MVTINGKEYIPKIDNVTVLQYASYLKVGISKLEPLLEDPTPAFLVGVVVFALRAENYNVSENDLWDEIRKRPAVLPELLQCIATSLQAYIPEEEQAKKKTVKK